MTRYDTVVLERRGNVALVTLNRPQLLNALGTTVLADVQAAFDECERDDDIGAIVLTGAGRAFAAGADIAEMQPRTSAEMLRTDFLAAWERVAATRIPTIAAVSGYALGGGCELAMMCDLVVASDTARFGQPEINLGVIPGMGGSQRLTRAVGKATAMDMVLTGRILDAEEALRAGLVSRIVPDAELLDEAIRLGGTIAARSRLAAVAAKEAVNRSFETGLQEGLLFERRLFHALFALDDQKEGMAAFLDKREPRFHNR